MTMERGRTEVSVDVPDDTGSSETDVETPDEGGSAGGRASGLSSSPRTVRDVVGCRDRKLGNERPVVQKGWGKREGPRQDREEEGIWREASIRARGVESGGGEREKEEVGGSDGIKAKR